ncbi:DoxX family protein [Pedobacter insulae]|uniref:Putative oxidoreductase n=1 Tax=Pedobacter insulae TaxID=414048 RepID=A0A1I2XIC9_9SPHI|nr:DoxX family protein [Pedobacter insulae]SFH12827.1 putative oxidoreductase [Pedobacter insulae]
MAILASLGKYRNTGLLIIRVGIGAMMMVHGYPKISGGIEMWKQIGGSMQLLGIDFFPAVWGFLAATIEAVGGLFLLLGLFFRPANILLLFVMIIACLVHLSDPKQGIMEASHAIELGVLFLGLLFIGPGKYSVDKK